MALSHSPQIVTDGLVLCLDAANLKSYPGSGVTWSDLSGKNNSGTLINGPTYTTTNGGYITFDGYDDLGEVTSNSSIEISGNITMEVWVYLLVFGTGGIVSKGPIGGDYDYMIYHSAGGSGSLAFYKKNDSGTVGAVNYTTTILNRWVHTCWVYNGSTIVGYENGVQAVSGAASGNIRTSSVSLKIGAGWTNYRNCQIAQTKIYNRALSASEVLQNFNALRGRFGI